MPGESQEEARIKRKRFTEEQIVAIQKEAAGSDNALLVPRKHGLTDTTFFRRKKKDGGMGPPELKSRKAIEGGNLRLERIVADRCLDNAMLIDAEERKW